MLQVRRAAQVPQVVHGAEVPASAGAASQEVRMYIQTYVHLIYLKHNLYEINYKFCLMLFLSVYKYYK